MTLDDLQPLLAELHRDPHAVGTIDSSKMIIKSGGSTLEVGHEDCEKLLQTAATVRQMADALGPFDDRAEITLNGVEVGDDVLAALERHATVEQV